MFGKKKDKGPGLDPQITAFELELDKIFSDMKKFFKKTSNPCREDVDVFDNRLIMLRQKCNLKLGEFKKLEKAGISTDPTFTDKVKEIEATAQVYQGRLQLIREYNKL